MKTIIVTSQTLLFQLQSRIAAVNARNMLRETTVMSALLDTSRSQMKIPLAVAPASAMDILPNARWHPDTSKVIGKYLE